MSPQRKMVSVDACALSEVLNALIGPPHLIRELIVLNNSSITKDDNPIDTLILDFNKAVLGMDSTMTFTEKNTASSNSEIEQPDTFIQPKITGYRQLTKEEADLINEAKALADQCGAFIEKLKTHGAQYGHPDGFSPGKEPLLDQRWISIGATDLQKGWMSVIRGIAQPTTF